mmetsp:Transcript_35740/g.95787  ORF Transcript_35740/g.95787 Transcript_35740/m.95787 type:complete len:291 (+) Transcript_35740:140-1012(+)
MLQSISYNDGVLVASLLYSCTDLRHEWDMFDSCARPVHHWLLASYTCVLAFRAVHLLGMHVRNAQVAEGGPDGQGAQGAGGFLVDLRHKHAFVRALTLFTWLLALPLFAACTAVGTAWLLQVARETPQCMPTRMHTAFSVFWLVLCYLWLIIHLVLGAVAATLERRVRRAEGDLREIEDADVISRWGTVSHLSSFSSLAGAMGGSGGGLAPAEIRALPEGVVDAGSGSGAGDELECSICIMPFDPGDKVRRLPGCGHVFHKSCVDLWLLRSAECPLCKRSLRGVNASCNC